MLLFTLLSCSRQMKFEELIRKTRQILSDFCDIEFCLFVVEDFFGVKEWSRNIERTFFVVMKKNES